MARSAAVACAETPSHSRGPGNIRVTVRVSFTTGAVRSAILATAGLLVQKPRGQTSPNFPCMLPVAAAGSYFHGVAICYVGLLPVFWVASCFHTMGLYCAPCLFLSGDSVASETAA